MGILDKLFSRGRDGNGGNRKIREKSANVLPLRGDSAPARGHSNAGLTALPRVNSSVLKAPENPNLKRFKDDLNWTLNAEFAINRNLAATVANLERNKSPYLPESVINNIGKFLTDRQAIDVDVERFLEQVLREYLSNKFGPENVEKLFSDLVFRLYCRLVRLNNESASVRTTAYDGQIEVNMAKMDEIARKAGLIRDSTSAAAMAQTGDPKAKK